jgi:hypothetical protein
MKLRWWMARQVRRIARPAHDEVREVVARAHGAVQDEGRRVVHHLQSTDRAIAHLDARIASLQAAVDRFPHDARQAHDAMIEMSVYLGRALRDVRDSLDSLSKRLDELEASHDPSMRPRQRTGER